MNGYRLILMLITALFAALLLIACGQTSQRRMPSSVIQPASINLADTLAQLDAMQAPEGVNPAVFEQLKSSLRAALVARGVDKIVSTPPTGAANAVPDFAITDTGGGTADLTWHYYNQGDYNQDGVVGVSDITPLAMHFGEGWSIGQENTLPAVVDGSGDGTVNIADVTPIAMNFGVECASYVIESSDAEGGTYTAVQNVPIAGGLDKDTERMRFLVNITLTPGLWYRVVPIDSSEFIGVPSNAVQPIVPGTPVASIVPDFTTGEVPLVVQLDASGSTDDGTIDLYEWDLDGDGTFDFDTGTTPTTNANFTQVGEYHPSVRVTDNDSLSDTATVTITVLEPNVLPVAAITSDFTTGVAPLSVTLDASTSTDSDGTIVNYEWDLMGDGTFELDTSEVSSFSYIYTVNGIYNPAVRVTDDRGGQDTASITITVNYPTWATTWGSTGTENARGLEISPSGYVFQVGSTDSYEAGTTAASIIRYDDTGALLWAKTWGGPNEDIAMDVATDTNDNSYVVGGTMSYGAGSYDAFLIKVDASGNPVYENYWGGTGYDGATSVCLDLDGNVYVAGVTEYNPSGSDFFLYKFDTSGFMLWRRVWSNWGAESASNLAVDNAGNIYVVGYADSLNDAVLVRYDPSGTIVWQKTWGGSGLEIPLDVAVDGSGNVFITGESDSFGAGMDDVFLIKYDSTGVLLWQQLWGGSLYDGPKRIAIDASAGDVFVAGTTTSFGAGDYDAFVLQYNSDGGLLKQSTWGGTFNDMALGLDIAAGGVLYFSGYSPDASSAWRSLSGTVTPGSGIAADVFGSFDDPGWVVFAIMEALTDQVGVIDTGGGLDDNLLVKANPSLI